MRKQSIHNVLSTKLIEGPDRVFNPPPARMVVGLVVFNGDSIVGFGFGPPAATGSAFHPVGWRGDRKAGDVTPVGQLTPFQLAYCRAWKVDMPDTRGKFLADYFG